MKPRELVISNFISESPMHMDNSEHIALREHPHVQTVLVRLEKRRLDSSVNGEAYRTAKSVGGARTCAQVANQIRLRSDAVLSMDSSIPTSHVFLHALPLSL